MLSPHITPLTVSHFNMHLNLKSARQIAACKRTLIAKTHSYRHTENISLDSELNGYYSMDEFYCNVGDQ